MMVAHADGSAVAGSIPAVSFGRSPDVYDGRPRGRPTVSSGQCAAKVPHGAGETPVTHYGPNRPPAAPVSTQNVTGRVKARSTVLHGVRSLTAVICACKGVASGQASEHHETGLHPCHNDRRQSTSVVRWLRDRLDNHRDLTTTAIRRQVM